MGLVKCTECPVMVTDNKSYDLTRVQRRKSFLKHQTVLVGFPGCCHTRFKKQFASPFQLELAVAFLFLNLCHPTACRSQGATVPVCLKSSL